MTNEFYDKVDPYIKPYSFYKGENTYELLKEWKDIEVVDDLFSASGICGLCGYGKNENGNGIRYEHHIENKYNKNIIKVGSTCIEHFLAETTDNDIKNIQDLIQDRENRAGLEKKKVEISATLKVLKDKKLLDVEWYYRYLSYFEEYKGFSIQHLVNIARNLKKIGLEDKMKYFYPANLNRKIKKGKNKGKTLKGLMMELKLYEFKLIKPCLSSSQIREYEKYHGLRK
ncbi:hypothetical protein IMZ31_22270 (plasmid) [Pontibacillus sp. ALD_SL1]|uniref:hypothetical protein n=1 Tax=Pontibacillus sp. ALD_SL1 TaxID=2777185 RepID=UPI001A95C334|nr:hypothetical protein [Pontibacillus sp. ALD_SL1]QST02181.1 hypothetical protein IMZ31_22270 [Pontibacillus sp. ALD_SL1]